MGRKSKTEGVQVYIQLIHFAIQQTLTQHFKAIKLKKKKVFFFFFFFKIKDWEKSPKYKERGSLGWIVGDLNLLLWGLLIFQGVYGKHITRGRGRQGLLDISVCPGTRDSR